LSLPLPLDEYGVELAALVSELEGEFPGRDAAVRLAAIAQLHLQRVRRMRTLVLQEAAQARREDGASWPDDANHDLSLALADQLARLLILDGYERKARSRRKRAFRMLVE
jgi:hypothetical protein